MSGAWVAAYVALATAVVLTLLVVLGTLRRTNALLEDPGRGLAGEGADGAIDLGGVAPGTVLPEFELVDRHGRTLPSDDLFADGAVVVFLGATCPPCRRLLEGLDGVGSSLEGVPLYFVAETEVPLDYEVPGDLVVLRQQGRAASTAFENKATPQAFAVAPGGVVTDVLIPDSRRHLRQLAEQLSRGGDAAAPLAVIRSAD